MAVALIQGASRGLGLQFAQILASRANVAKVIATSRTAENAASLTELRQRYPDKIHLVNVDVTNEEHIKSCVPIIKEQSGGRIDLLINCSAILHPSGKGETSLRDVSLEVIVMCSSFKKTKFLNVSVTFLGTEEDIRDQYNWTFVNGKVLLAIDFEIYWFHGFSS